MALVVLSPEAQGDSDAIITGLARDAGLPVAHRFAGDFDAAYRFLGEHPEGGPRRPRLGPDVRIKIVMPFVLIYVHDEAAGSVTVLRIIHGRRRITRRLLP